MSKAILVMDMPSSCEECEFCIEVSWKRHFCKLKENEGVYKEIDDYVVDRRFGKPYWCPLREVPQKKESDIEKYSYEEMKKWHYSNGYNACIDEILWGDE